MERRLQAADQMLALRQAMADDSEGRRLSVDMKVAITGHVRRQTGRQIGGGQPGPPPLGVLTCIAWCGWCHAWQIETPSEVRAALAYDWPM